MRRFRDILPPLVLGALFASPALGVGPHFGPRIAADTLTAMPAAGVAKPLRIQQRLLWARAAPSAAWTKFATAAGGSWQAAWDAATGVPAQIWGSGIAAPGSIAHADIAEQIARKLLADHVALLAPGAAASDFQLASNTFDGDIRSVGFVQLAGGRRVVGGQVSFLFKRDRMFVIGSAALPNVAITAPTARLAPVALRDRATAALRAAVQLSSAPVTAPGAEVVLPLVGDDAVLGYRVVVPMTIDGGADGRYEAYAEPATGGIVAVHQLNEYATGTLLYHGVDRYPGRGYVDRPAPRAYVMVNGAAQTTSPGGAVTWSDGTVPIDTAVTGDLATIINKEMGGAAASTELSITPDGQVVWDASAATVPQPDGCTSACVADHQDDAQLNAYLDVNIVKEYVRANIDASMPTLDDQMTINVNIEQDCNAFFDGKALNFFHATAMCENTARVQDVGFHEFGHDVHASEIITGVGAFDGAMSEGAADFLAASVTGDSGMGRGFFYTDAPLRDIDPPNLEYTWPFDIGEIHHTGLIFSGTFWDLRKTLIAQYGDGPGIALTNKLYVGALRRSINIPTSLVATLAADDDDGDLSNGTPHECAIRDAFGRHGLRTATGTVVAPGTLDVNALAIGVLIDVTGLSTRCNGDGLAGATLLWRPPYTGIPAAGQVAATPGAPDQFFAELPLSPQESIFYRVHVNFQDGSALTLADNLADPDYQLYTGRTVKLYCTDFESGDPLQAGWATGTDDGTPSPWSWGTPLGGGATDPPAAYSGTHILTQVLDGDYAPSSESWVATPEIDVGAYSDVRLQYRRWLAVEDSHYNQAKVLANDNQAWINFTQDLGDSSSINHVDKEWRFHDVPLSGFFTGRKLTVSWSLKSDPGLELGGWALDDVCIVANPYAICGDGIKTATEQCDNGMANANAADACRTDCRLPTCGDNIVDSTEQCDDGPQGSTSCSTKCALTVVGGGGCCSASGGSGSLLLGIAVGGLVLRRRRRK